MSIEGHDCWEDCDEGPHGCVCGNDCSPSIREYTPTTEEVRIKYRLSSGRQPGDFAEFDRWLAAHDAVKRAEWEAEQGWEYAIGAQSEDRPGKFWRDSDWDTTTELHEALGDLEDALPVFSNAVVIRRRPSTPWLPVPDTTNNESEDE